MAPSTRELQLNRRCALFTLLAMAFSIGVGLLAWGPIRLSPATHVYADARSLIGLPQAMNVAMSLVMLAAGAWGWRALGRSVWPAALRTPWRWSFGCIGASAALAALYHLAPSDALYVAAQCTAAGALILLLCGFLAERVDERFGSPQAPVVALGVVLLAAALSSTDTVDLRPVMLLQLLPVLLIPAGALSLPGRQTTRRDWLLILGLYALARVLDLGDDAVMRFSGRLVGGHALMHLCLAGVAACLAYRASAAGAVVADADGADLTQISTSLSTSG